MTSLSDKVSEPGAAADSGEARRFASFIVTGGIAALVNLGVALAAQPCAAL
jgi:putative flippase GtrA